MGCKILIPLGLISKILIAKDLAADWPPVECWFGLGGKSQAGGRAACCAVSIVRGVSRGFERFVPGSYDEDEPGEGRGMEGIERITRNPAVMSGKACIRGMRVTVGMVVGLIGSGRSVDEVLAAYPYLEREDILQALS